MCIVRPVWTVLRYYTLSEHQRHVAYDYSFYVFVESRWNYDNSMLIKHNFMSVHVSLHTIKSSLTLSSLSQPQHLSPPSSPDPRRETKTEAEWVPQHYRPQVLYQAPSVRLEFLLPRLWMSGAPKTSRSTRQPLSTIIRACGRTARCPRLDSPSAILSSATWATQVG